MFYEIVHKNKGRNFIKEKNLFICKSSTSEKRQQKKNFTQYTTQSDIRIIE